MIVVQDDHDLDRAGSPVICQLNQIPAIFLDQISRILRHLIWLPLIEVQPLYPMSLRSPLCDMYFQPQGRMTALYSDGNLQPR